MDPNLPFGMYAAVAVLASGDPPAEGVDWTSFLTAVAGTITALIPAVVGGYIMWRKWKVVEERRRDGNDAAKTREQQELEQAERDDIIRVWRNHLRDREAQHRQDVASFDARIKALSSELREIREAERKCQIEQARQSQMNEYLQQQLEELRQMLRDRGVQLGSHDHPALPKEPKK